jgi:hypothetical protein
MRLDFKVKGQGLGSWIGKKNDSLIYYYSIITLIGYVLKEKKIINDACIHIPAWKRARWPYIDHNILWTSVTNLMASLHVKVEVDVRWCLGTLLLDNTNMHVYILCFLVLETMNNWNCEQIQLYKAFTRMVYWIDLDNLKRFGQDIALIFRS